MQKLVYIANIALPSDWGHSVQIMKMCEAFSEQTDVTLVVRGKSRNPFAFYNVKPSFKIVSVPAINLSNTSPSRVVFWTRMISFLISAKIYLLFKKFDIVYTREMLAGMFFKSLFIERHSFSVNDNFKNAKGVIALTSFIKEKIAATGVPPEKILVAGDAVRLEDFEKDISKIEARKVLNLPIDKKIIGYIGTLKTMGKEKGVSVAIDALPQDYILYIVGGEPEDIAFYKHYAKGKDVIFSGKVPHRDVAMHMAACDILVAPFPDTMHYREYMSPLKIFEYMASRRPIIASDLPSIREVLKNEENAILVAPGNVDNLAEAIKGLSGETGNRLAENAFHEVQQKYTWKIRASKIFNFIHEAHYSHSNL